MSIVPAVLSLVLLVMNGVKFGTTCTLRRFLYITPVVFLLTLNSDDGRCGVGATKSGSTGVESSLRC